VITELKIEKKRERDSRFRTGSEKKRRRRTKNSQIPNHSRRRRSNYQFISGFQRESTQKQNQFKDFRRIKSKFRIKPGKIAKLTPLFRSKFTTNPETT